MQPIKITFEFRRLSCAVLSVFGPFLISAVILSGLPANLAASPEAQNVLSKAVTIETKDGKAIMIAGQRHEVTESTIILDLNGQGLSLCDLPVPCEAEVDYRLRKNQDPICVSIKIRRVPEGATSLIIVDDPG